MVSYVHQGHIGEGPAQIHGHLPGCGCVLLTALAPDGVLGDLFIFSQIAHHLDQIHILRFPADPGFFDIDLMESKHERQHPEEHRAQQQKFLFHDRSFLQYSY